MEINYEPGYRKLLASGELKERVKKAERHLTEYNLCPHNCEVDRKKELGFCRATEKVVISSYGPLFLSTIKRSSFDDLLMD